MQEVLLVKRPGRLVAADQLSADILSGLRDGEIVRARVGRPRNPKHHAMAFALFKLIFDAQDRYPTLKHLVDVIKIGVGHYDVREIAGREVIELRSISYAAMDQHEFGLWWMAVVELVAREILPGIEGTDLEREIEAITGERAPRPRRQQPTNATEHARLEHV